MTRDDVIASLKPEYWGDPEGNIADSVEMSRVAFDRLLDAFMLMQEQRDLLVEDLDINYPRPIDEMFAEFDAAVRAVLEGT